MSTSESVAPGLSGAPDRTSSDRTAPDPTPGPSRLAAALGLAVIVCIQLMVVLDTTVVNVALPVIQTDLGFSTASLSWVLNAYTLAFGGLLLLGARAGDILGRRPVLLAGVALFTIASLVGGLANGAEMLLIARTVQGIGAAIAAPQALALLTTMFSDGRERTRALGIYSAVSVGGGSLGLVLGGLLTDTLSWRWGFFINLPIGIALLILGPRYLVKSPRNPGRFDLPGSITGTLGMVSLVYGFVNAAAHGWTNGETLLAFAWGILMLAGYIAIEARAEQPITPLRLFAHRDRVVSYVARLLLSAAMTGMFYFLTLFMQQVLNLSPLITGVGFLPLTFFLFAASQLSARVLVQRFGAKLIMIIGISLSTCAMVWLTQISVDSSYLFILPPLMMFGLGNGLAFVPLTAVSLTAVAPEDAGAGSGLVNVMQQVGGSLGLSILVTVFGAATRGASGSEREVLTAGFSQAFVGSAIFAALTLALIFAVRNRAKA